MSQNESDQDPQEEIDKILVIEENIQNITETYGMGQNPAECDGMWWNVTECDGMWWNVMECDGMWRKAVEYDRTIWKYVTEHDGIG